MRLTDHDLHELMRHEAPHVEVNHTLMSELMKRDSIFIVGKRHTFVCIKYNDKAARWELITL